MIEQLKNEIRDLERTLEHKKNQLKKMIEDAFFEKSKVIAIVEMQDQFSGVTNIDLVDDTETAIKEYKESYQGIMIYYEVSFFRIPDVEMLKEDFKHLNTLLANGYYGQDSMYEWIEEHQEQLIKLEGDDN